MTPLSAPDASIRLVARILQPLARSLAEARHHLDLEAADEAPADDAASASPDAPPAFAPRRHDRQHEPAHPAAAIPLPAMTRAASRQAATGAPSLKLPAAPHAVGTEAPSPGHPAARPAGHRSIERRSDASPSTPPAWHGTAGPGAHAPTTPPPDEPATASAVAPVANRNADSPAPAPVRSGAAAAGLRVAHPPTTAPDSAPAAAAAEQIHRAGPPLRTIGAARTQPDHLDTATDAGRTQPSPPSAPQHRAATAAAPSVVASHAGTPAPTAPAADEPRPAPAAIRPPRNWRLRPTPLRAVEPSSNPPPGEPSEQAAGHPAAPQPAAPSLLPRNPALTRVMQAMDPVLDRAWQLTDAALQPATDAAPAPAADTPAPRVANHFHVNVALGSDTAAGRDPQQLQDALAALLRDAARRQGLDV